MDLMEKYRNILIGSEIREHSLSSSRVVALASGEKERQPSWIPKYTIIYSHLLDDCLLLVRTEAEADALRRQGVEDVIYTAAEVQALKDKSRGQVAACHNAKKIYPDAKVSE